MLPAEDRLERREPTPIAFLATVAMVANNPIARAREVAEITQLVIWPPGLFNPRGWPECMASREERRADG